MSGERVVGSGRSQATPAVVLRTSALGEADQLVVLLTLELGKVSTAARHARRSRRRFPGGLSTGARGTATIVDRPRGLVRLDGFVPTSDHAKLGRDLDRLAYAAYVCELIDQLVLEREPDARLFATLTRAVGEIVDGQPTPTTLRRFELELLELLGHLPALESCCACGSRAIEGQDPVAFDLERGGVLCPVHAAGAGSVGAEVLQIAASLLTGDTQALDEAEPAVRKGLRDLTQAVLRQHLRRPLRSLEFFAQLRGRGGGS